MTAGAGPVSAAAALANAASSAPHFKETSDYRDIMIEHHQRQAACPIMHANGDSAFEHNSLRNSKRIKRQDFATVAAQAQAQAEAEAEAVAGVAIAPEPSYSTQPDINLLACYEDASFLYCAARGPSQSSLSGDSALLSPTCSSASSLSSQTSAESSSPHSPGLLSLAVAITGESEEDSLGSADSSTSITTPTKKFKTSKLPPEVLPKRSRSRSLRIQASARLSVSKRVSTASHSDYCSSSPASSNSCVSALGYCHLSSAAPLPAAQNCLLLCSPVKAGESLKTQLNNQHNEQQSESMSGMSRDPVYLDDAQVLRNLILREGTRVAFRPVEAKSDQRNPFAEPQQRHQLCSWMLKVCEQQVCQDEIFPLAVMILDNFLAVRPCVLALNCLEQESINEFCEDPHLEAEELERRQLYLFAVCALLLATKLRQTPRLCIATLIEASATELNFPLTRDEVLDGELLVLSALKWDLAALVPPNDFLTLLLRHCHHIWRRQHQDHHKDPTKMSVCGDDHGNTTIDNERKSSKRENSTSTTNADERRVRRHTQTLLELCFMDSQLSQYAPSVLAMASMAVAIDGLRMSRTSCRRGLPEIVGQIHDATQECCKIESYVQKLLNSTHHD